LGDGIHSSFSEIVVRDKKPPPPTQSHILDLDHRLDSLYTLPGHDIHSDAVTSPLIDLHDIRAAH